MVDDLGSVVRALRAFRSLSDRRGTLPLTDLLEALAKCAATGSGAAAARIELGALDPPGSAMDLATNLVRPLVDDRGRVRGSLLIEGVSNESLDELAEEMVRLCVAEAIAAITEAERAGDLEREASRRDAVHAVVRASVQHLDLDDMLRDAVDVLRRGVRCQGVWIRAFDSPHPASLRRYAASYPTWADSLATDELLDISGRAARICWERQQVSSLHIEEPDVEPLTTPDERDFMFDFMRSIEARGLLMAPMGGAGECQGFIALTRTTVDEPFDLLDEAAVMAIGRELGSAVVHARLFDQQRGLVAELQELDRYKNSFVATVAHQLKNPLTSIVGHVEYLEEALLPAGAADEATARSLGTIQRGAERIRDTVEALLTLSKVQDPRRPFVPGEVRLGALVRECCELLSVTAADHGVWFEVDGVDSTPPAWGDRGELEKVVDNLIGNAVKYSPDGGRVRVSMHEEDGMVMLECQDAGLGIPHEEIARLFEPFHRSSGGRSLEIPGTGLGMAIVKAVVDRHEGRIDVESDLGRGSTFWLQIPAAPPLT